MTAENTLYFTNVKSVSYFVWFIHSHLRTKMLENRFFLGLKINNIFENEKCESKTDEYVAICNYFVMKEINNHTYISELDHKDHSLTKSANKL